MCGIVGAFGPTAASLADNLAIALKSIRHRGPDAIGTYIAPKKHCILGHVRLAILDLRDKGNQPMESGKGALAYNGEIYNHNTLRNTILSNKTTFDTTCDTETLLHGLDESQYHILPHLQGMFAGAYFNKTSGSLTLFRDKLGMKPLYMMKLPDSTVAFASEIKALRALVPQKTWACSNATLVDYLRYENYSQSASLFEDVQMLPAGNITTLYMNQALVKSENNFFTPSVSCLNQGDKHTQCRNILHNTVKNHLLSDAQVGVYLSGGIDSSIVAALASQYKSGLLGYTGFFKTKYSHYDESSLAEKVAEKTNIKLTKIAITPEHFIKYFDQVIWHLDEPRMGMGAFSQYIVAKHASEQCKVILTGHGGDELFSGYPIFKAHWLLNQLRQKQVTGKIFKIINKTDWPWIVWYLQHYYWHKRLSFAPQLMPNSWLSSSSKINIDFIHDDINTNNQALTRYYFDTYLAGLLVVEDKISMAHGLETRLPLLDTELIQFAMTLSPNEKMPNGQLKGFLKTACANLLPKELLDAPKRGFPTPLRLWFRNELFNFVHSRLIEQDSTVHNLFPKSRIKRLLSCHKKIPLPFAMDEKRAHMIWILLCLESWTRQCKIELST